MTIKCQHEGRRETKMEKKVFYLFKIGATEIYLKGARSHNASFSL